MSVRAFSLSLLVAVMAWSAAWPKGAANRRYYSGSDTVVAVPDVALETFAVEMRCALPGMKEGRGCSADWWGMETADGQWVALRGFNSDYGTLLDRRGLRISYGRRGEDGSRVATDSVDVYEGMELLRGHNTLAMEWIAPGSLTIYAGSREPRQVMTVEAAMPAGEVAVTGHGCRQMETVVTEWTVDDAAELITSWTIEELDERLAASTDPLEGMWRYFDRSTDDSRARIGGKHLIAVVADCQRGGYTVLYVDGAVTGSTLWRPMMMKGRLVASPFEQMWNVVWYDATAAAVDDDEAYARLSMPEGILTVEFPLYRSRIRFVKDNGL